MPKKILTLDSSQIDSFLTCPTLWFYHYKKRLEQRPRDGFERNKTPMDMGTYGHKLLEIIYKERAKGNHLGATDVAFAYDLDKETCRCSHGREYHRVWAQDWKESNNLKGSDGCGSIGCTCTEFEPVEFPLNAVDREFTRERVLQYTFVEGSTIPELIPKSEKHVEVGFSHKLYEDSDRLYILEGRIDLLGQIARNVEEGWADHKFQARERNLYLKSIQFRNYAMVTQLPLGVVNYIRFAKKIEKDHTFKRDLISFSRAELDWWRGELIKVFHKVENVCNPVFPDTIPSGVDWQWYDSSDTLRNRSACSGKFGYPCDYVSLCEDAMVPQLIKIREDNDFIVKPAWRPW